MNAEIVLQGLDAELADLELVAGQPCNIADMMADFIAHEVACGDLTLVARRERNRKLHRPTRHLTRAINLAKAKEMAA